MGEQILAPVVGRDESKAFCVVKPLYRTCTHADLPWKGEGLRPKRGNFKRKKQTGELWRERASDGVAACQRLKNPAGNVIQAYPGKVKAIRGSARFGGPSEKGVRSESLYCRRKCPKIMVTLTCCRNPCITNASGARQLYRASPLSPRFSCSQFPRVSVEDAPAMLYDVDRDDVQLSVLSARLSIHTVPAVRRRSCSKA